MFSLGVSEAAYTDTSAENGTKYYYRVTSFNPEEESSASNEVEKTPFSDPPTGPNAVCRTCGYVDGVPPICVTFELTYFCGST